MVKPDNFWESKRVFITGHTGFKGAWLSNWLNHLGAEVHGYALPPHGTENLFSCTGLAQKLATNSFADIRDEEKLKRHIESVNPEIVFHLAAQSLVRESYFTPKHTLDVNIMGTVNLLETLRIIDSNTTIVNITSDKCYYNDGQNSNFIETDKLGGDDPYSSSKACSEIVSHAFNHSFFKNSNIRLATARAGNVIGGGDWARDRLIPDVFRSIESDKSLVIRYPHATRPWQHVLEPLNGYMKLAEKVYKYGGKYCDSWNFGPEDADNKTVLWILEYISKSMPNFRFHCESEKQLYESSTLKLGISKSLENLCWAPQWDISTAIEMTLNWHQSFKTGKNMREETLKQIDEYQESKK